MPKIACTEDRCRFNNNFLCKAKDVLIETQLMMSPICMTYERNYYIRE